jgi:hypothetical protein
MKLDREDGQLPMPHAFDGVVIEVDVGGLEGLWHGARINGKAVIFGGDEHALGLQIADGLITAVMSEFQLHGFGASGQGEYLMP